MKKIALQIIKNANHNFVNELSNYIELPEKYITKRDLNN